MQVAKAIPISWARCSKAIDREIIQGEELAGENYDIVPLFRELIPKLTLDALDIMEKELRESKDSMTKRALFSYFSKEG